jgi:polar amino acid transport system substrate-binding protein
MHRVLRVPPALLLVAVALSAQEPNTTRPLRAVFLASNPVQAKLDPSTGKVSGPAADLLQALAGRLRTTATLTGVPDVKTVVAKVRDHEADLGFLAPDPTRAAEVSFSQVYSLALNTLLVPADSPLRNAAEIDRTGFRIGVEQNISADLYLTRNIRDASIVRTGLLTEAQILEKLRAKEFDGWAANKQRLTELLTPGFRILDGSFFSVRQAIAVSKDNEKLLNEINSFLDEALDSGLVRKALSDAKLNGVEPAR